MKDAQIVLHLEEKLQVFAALTETVAGVEDTTPYHRLLLRGSTADLQQGEQLLNGAIADGKDWQIKFHWCQYIYCQQWFVQMYLVISQLLNLKQWS